MQDNNDERLDENEIENEFHKVLDELTDNEFWEYVRSWLDIGHIADIMKNWDIETKAQAIEEMKKLIIRCEKCGSPDCYESDLHPLYKIRCNACGHYFAKK
jgi:ribosomal protein S27E